VIAVVARWATVFGRDQADAVATEGSAQGPGLRRDLRAVSIVWRRELLRVRGDRLRMLAQLIQPVLFLFILGTGLSGLAKHGLAPGVSYRTFVYPGVLTMSVLFTAMVSAGSIVWDREFGFLREMFVAPVRRWSLVSGKCLGGATVATFEGIALLTLAGLAGVPYTPLMVLTLLGELLLIAFTTTAFGVMLAARVRQVQAFMALTQMLVLPLFFLSGALYPLNSLPAWLTVLTRVDPLTYIVYPMRSAVAAHLALSPAGRAAVNPALTWAGWPVPPALSLGVVAGLALIMVGAAIAQLGTAE
jgi:ABC-2 type transport system permease protein